MRQIKTDEQILKEYLPKLKRFTDERLTSENAKWIYDLLKPYHYDTGGQLLYQAAKGILNTDAFDEIYHDDDNAHHYEDTVNYLETLDGYELLKYLETMKLADGTLVENSHIYQEYHNKLWVDAVRSITSSLTEKQLYQLPVFWSRLSFIENILLKGFPTRDNLIDKIDNEVKSLNDEGEKAVKGRDLSENQEKMNFRNILYNTPMSAEMIEALYIKDNILDELYVQSFEFGEIGDYYDFVSEYVEKTEHEYLADRVFDRVKLEYEIFIDEIKEKPVDKIIDEADKISLMYDLYIALDPYVSDLSTERLRVLKSLDSPLWSLYHEWQRRDWTYSEDISDVIRETADGQISEIGENEYDLAEYSLDPYEIYKILKEEEAEDGQEP